MIQRLMKAFKTLESKTLLGLYDDANIGTAAEYTEYTCHLVFATMANAGRDGYILKPFLKITRDIYDKFVLLVILNPSILVIARIFLICPRNHSGLLW